MSSSVYDPQKFEFVARMGRIPSPAIAANKRMKNIPVTFHIPDLPEQEIVAVPHDRSMQTELVGGSSNIQPPDMDDSLENLPPHANSVQQSNDEQEKKNRLLEKMVQDRKKTEKERERQRLAQHLVNETFLQTELQQQKKEDMPNDDKLSKPYPDTRKMDMTNALFREFQPPVSEELMKEIRKELERLVPIAPDKND